MCIRDRACSRPPFPITSTFMTAYLSLLTHRNGRILSRHLICRKGLKVRRRTVEPHQGKGGGRLCPRRFVLHRPKVSFYLANGILDHEGSVRCAYLFVQFDPTIHRLLCGNHGAMASTAELITNFRKCRPRMTSGQIHGEHPGLRKLPRFI